MCEWCDKNGVLAGVLIKHADDFLEEYEQRKKEQEPKTNTLLAKLKQEREEREAWNKRVDALLKSGEESQKRREERREELRKPRHLVINIGKNIQKRN